MSLATDGFSAMMSALPICCAANSRRKSPLSTSARFDPGKKSGRKIACYIPRAETSVEASSRQLTETISFADNAKNPNRMTMPNKAISTDSLLQETRTFPPPPEVLQRAHLNAAQYNALYERSIREPDAFWLEQAHTLEWFRQPTVARKFTWDTDARNIQHTWFEDGQLNVTANCLDRHLKTKTRDKIAIIWQGEPEEDVKHITYAELHARGLQVRQCPEIARHSERRPRGDLHADDSRSRRGHARLRAHRRDSFGRVRRVQRRFAGRPHQRFRHAKCSSPPTFRCAAAKAFRSRPSPMRPCKKRPSIEKVVVVKRNDEPCNFDRRPRRLVSRIDGQGLRGLPAGKDECRGFSVHPLHLRLDRQTQGRRPQHRRLSALERADAQIRFRYPRRRRLFLHGGHRLGDRPQLRRLWPAVQRRRRR